MLRNQKCSRMGGRFFEGWMGGGVGRWGMIGLSFFWELRT